jgi:hypothetical protein
MVEKKKTTNKTNKTANTQNINSLMAQQTNTSTQINDMLNQSLAAITVNPEAQRQQTLNNLEQNYLDAQTNLQTAPVQLETTKKNYYVYKVGETNYNNMQEQEVQQQADLITQQIANKFNEETNNAHLMNSYYNTEVINSANTIELYEEYLKKNADLEKSIKELHGDVLTNDRKTYYENDAIDNVKLWHKFFKICYYILVATYVISIFVSTSEMSRVKQVVIALILAVYPFIIDPIVKWLYSMYLSLENNAPSNVYMKL